MDYILKMILVNTLVGVMVGGIYAGMHSAEFGMFARCSGAGGALGIMLGLASSALSMKVRDSEKLSAVVRFLGWLGIPLLSCAVVAFAAVWLARYLL